MAKYKLTYFDFDGGRGEPLRIALHAAGIEFTDQRISFQEFGAQRKDYRFGAVPLLEIDGNVVSQSNSLNRYIGRIAGLYPEDATQALYCDEAMDAIEDMLHYIVQTFGLEGDALREAREKLANTRLRVILTGLAELLERGGSQYFADNRLTMADLKVFVQIRTLVEGKLDHVSADFVRDIAPSIADHHARINAEPVVTAYYDSRSNAG